MDFDGTITTRDTTRYLVAELLKRRPWRAYSLLGLILARLSGDAAKLQYWKNRCIGTLIAGVDENELQQVAQRFHARVRPMFRETVMRALRDSLADGHSVLIVTASPEFAVEGLFREFGVGCVGTRYEKLSGVYTGRIDGGPCYGEAKVPAIWKVLGQGEAGVEVVAAWSDALSDMPMMELAEKRCWVTSDPKVMAVVKGDGKSVVVGG